MQNELKSIEGGKPDEQAIANDLRQRYARIMGDVASLMTEAERSGMAFQFAGIQRDQWGKYFVSPVAIVKFL